MNYALYIKDYQTFTFFVMTNNPNKLIVKNTLLLYGRMLLLLAVSLYTSRVVLAVLGIDDYGLYNVVGGIVSMFSFVNLAMSNSSNRYIAFALGKGDATELKEVVDATCMIHWLIAGLILLLAETIGLWFLLNKIVVPEGREVAAFWAYQFSIISCVISIVSVPYNALIIAHEKMGTFAFVSILDAMLKLLIVFLIQISGFDKLILYSVLMVCVVLIDRIIYRVYCHRFFEESRNIRFRRVPQLKEMSLFAGWSLFGNLAFMGYTQGLNILLNTFFGPSVNAARGVAVQMEGAIKGFVTNFQTAVNPQIVKSYAHGEMQRLHNLIYASSKLSFFLLYCMVLPVCVESDAILNIWLKDVPNHTVVFTILILMISLCEPLRNPIDRANMATGNIRKYQIIEGCMLMAILPIAYCVLRLGGAPYTVFIVQLGMIYLVQVVRLFIVCPKINMSKREYLIKVICPIVYVTLSASFLPILLFLLIPKSIISTIAVVAVSVVSVLICSYYLGLTTNERLLVRSKIMEIRSKIKRNNIESL